MKKMLQFLINEIVRIFNENIFYNKIIFKEIIDTDGFFKCYK